MDRCRFISTFDTVVLPKVHLGSCSEVAQPTYLFSKNYRKHVMLLVYLCFQLEILFSSI